MSEKMNSCHCPSRRLPLPVNPLADDQIFFWVGRPSGFTASIKKKKKKGGGNLNICVLHLPYFLNFKGFKSTRRRAV